MGKGNMMYHFEMSWSQAEHVWLVVYARNWNEALEKFENGEYVKEGEYE